MTKSPSITAQAEQFALISESLSALLSQYAAGNPPHALMISGQFGVGKATLAGLLAQALLCEGPDKPCGLCAGCRKAQTGNHPNLLQVRAADKQRSVKVEQARALLDSLATYPFEAGTRVVLLDQIDIFTPQAQNALLKAIEEPDSSTFFLLTCQNEQAVLITIRSRCQQAKVPDWDEEQISRLLTGRGIQPDEASRLAALSQGSPGKAIQIKDDQAFWEAKRLADETLLSVQTMADLPQASAALRDAREKANLMLDYVQGAALQPALNDPVDVTIGNRARALLESIVTARKYQASNLSWQAIADWMLMNIIKENTQCHP